VGTPATANNNAAYADERARSGLKSPGRVSVVCGGRTLPEVDLETTWLLGVASDAFGSARLVVCRRVVEVSVPRSSKAEAVKRHVPFRASPCSCSLPRRCSSRSRKGTAEAQLQGESRSAVVALARNIKSTYQLPEQAGRLDLVVVADGCSVSVGELAVLDHRCLSWPVELVSDAWSGFCWQTVPTHTWGWWAGCATPFALADRLAGCVLAVVVVTLLAAAAIVRGDSVIGAVRAAHGD
jgi:hypothetical protein